MSGEASQTITRDFHVLRASYPCPAFDTTRCTKGLFRVY
jgi:hypothetical protein